VALRAAAHPSHYLVNAAFLVVALLGWLAGVTYKARSVDRYVIRDDKIPNISLTYF
jgi:hypothetical protein